MSTNLVQIGAANIHDAERIKSHLAEVGVKLELAVAPGDCGGGKCGISAEIWAHPDDMPKVMEYFAAEHKRRHAGLEFDPQQISQVFDTSAAEATCPACGTRFATSHHECPDCGLSFGVPED